jgi:hypothetical protein
MSVFFTIHECVGGGDKKHVWKYLHAEEIRSGVDLLERLLANEELQGGSDNSAQLHGCGKEREKRSAWSDSLGERAGQISEDLALCHARAR